MAEGELEAFLRCGQHAFSEAPTPTALERERLALEGERAWVAVDRGEVVGTAAALALQMTVPGTVLAMAGVTGIGVLPSHRRQGVLRSLMRRQLDDLHAGGEAVAALYASESGIYRRFGYGQAGEDCHFSIPTAHARLTDPPVAAGRMRMVADPVGAVAGLAAGYDRACGGRPGMIRRSERWWRWWWADLTAEEPAPLLLAVHEDAGDVDGYVLYRVTSRWELGQPAGVLNVRELVGATAAVELALWEFCLGMDLVTEVESWHRPPDDPLRWVLAEPRRLRVTVRDGLWVGLVDCARALAGRRYAVEDRLVVDVSDEGCPWNAGRYQLEAGPDGAVCRRTRRSAMLELDTAALASAFLGASRLAWLARAGCVRERVAGAAARADRLLGWPVAPWSAELF